MGFGTATADAAIVLAEKSDQLAFLPEIIARDRLKRRTLKRIYVKNWPTVKRTVYLSMRTDTVTERLAKKMIASVSACL